MRLCDEVAGIAAVRHSGRRVVTAAMDRMTFLHPVFVGNLVTVRATVNAAWHTSMEVGVRVESEVVPTGERLHTSTAYLTLGALEYLGNLGVAVPLLERALCGLRVGADQVHQRGGGPHGHVAALELGHRALAAGHRDATAAHPGGAPDEQSSGLDLGGNVGQHL